MSGPPKRILEKLGTTGNQYGWVERLLVDFGDGPRETYRAGLPDGVSILPITDDGKVVLVRQYRVMGPDAWTLELPAGMMDEAAESAAECARRELQEETGYRAGEIVPLCSFYPHTIMDCRSHLFLARKLVQGEPERDAAENEMSVIEVTPEEFVAMCADGRIVQAQSIVACFLAKEKGLLGIKNR